MMNREHDGTRCPMCNGTGDSNVPARHGRFKYRACSWCKGTGRVSTDATAPLGHTEKEWGGA